VVSTRKESGPLRRLIQRWIVATGDALERAEALDLLVQRNPEAARQASQQLLLELPSRGQHAARCVARWALGRALFEMGQIDASLIELRGAAEAARRHGDQRTRARVQGTLAMVLVEAGRSGAALTMLRRAEPATPPELRGRMLTQLVLVHFHRGELRDALDVAGRALSLLRVHHDRLGELRLLVNRSIVWLNAGRPNDATRDLETARPLAGDLGQTLTIAIIDHNLAVAAGRSGRIPQSLALFERAAEGYAKVNSPARMTAILEVDRAEVLLHAGLHADAARSAAAAAELSERAGHAVSAAESLLLRARALTADGSPDAASAARAAASAFRRAGRRQWLVLARAIEWEIDSAVADGRTIARGRTLARALAEAGWVSESQRVAALVAVRALEFGTPESRVPELVDAEARRRSGPAWLRAQWWYVEAVRRRRRHEHRRALMAVDAGLRAIEGHRRAFGSLELRVGASSFGVPLAALALDIVSEGGDPRTVLRWADRWRASALGSRPAPEPPTAALAGALVALRTRQAALAQLAPGDDGYGREAAALARAQADVRRLAGASERRSSAVGSPMLKGIEEALGDAILVAYHERAGGIAAVVVRDGVAAFVEVGACGDVEAECQYLAGAVHRGIVNDSADHTLVEAGAAAEAALLPAAAIDADRPVVIIPSGALHKVPWGVLPSLGRRPVTVSPNASTWLRLQLRTAPSREPALLVAGTTLKGADREVRDVGGMVRGAVVVPASDARVADVISRIERAGLVHIAAHGIFRSDNPMLSSLELADGPLTVYDLEHLAHVPSTVVLSACSAGRVATPGAEVLGTVAVLLDRGVATIIAPTTVLPDRPAAAVMRALYDRLLAGDEPAAALAAVRRATTTAGSARDGLAASVLTCFGR
jgi:tetratricopeptide (TPR) repeat protein